MTHGYRAINSQPRGYQGGSGGQITTCARADDPQHSIVAVTARAKTSRCTSASQPAISRHTRSISVSLKPGIPPLILALVNFAFTQLSKRSPHPGMNERCARLDDNRDLIVVAIAEPIEGHGGPAKFWGVQHPLPKVTLGETTWRTR